MNERLDILNEYTYGLNGGVNARKTIQLSRKYETKTSGSCSTTSTLCLNPKVSDKHCFALFFPCLQLSESLHVLDVMTMKF